MLNLKRWFCTTFINTLKDDKMTISIIGRPNVGKSSLFNRLMGKKIALVDKTPGLTWDRREGLTEILGVQVRIVDTAGWEDVKTIDDSKAIKRSINKQMMADMINQTR
jgi:small GTP-binding protein